MPPRFLSVLLPQDRWAFRLVPMCIVVEATPKWSAWLPPRVYHIRRVTHIHDTGTLRIPGCYSDIPCNFPTLLRAISSLHLRLALHCLLLWKDKNSTLRNFYWNACINKVFFLIFYFNFKGKEYVGLKLSYWCE